MKRYVIILFLISLTNGTFGQETFLNNYMTNSSDLFGTARYVGMGGAMGALGADLGAISSNPAAIGIYRRSAMSLTAGAIWQADKNTDGEDRCHASLDQAGFVIAFNMSEDNKMRNFNFAVNYSKKNNLTHTFIADNTGSTLLNYIGGVYNQLYNCNYINPIVETAIDAGLFRKDLPDPYAVSDANADYYGNGFLRTISGNTQSYDINISGNYNDRLFWGVTIGLDVLRYNSEALYDEYWWPKNDNFDLSYSYNNSLRVRGTGYNIKVGAIYRPIADSPLRVGFAIETPTWYNIQYLGDCCYLTAYPSDSYEPNNDTYIYNSGSSTLRYNLSTPWRFRLSVGHTIGKTLALGAEYEYADYSYTTMGYDTGDNYNYDFWEEEKDKAMNSQTKKSLKGVHAVKLGGEWKPTANVALRAGYNYYSSSSKKTAVMDHTIDSYAMEFVNNTDYMLLGDVNIITLGAGYVGKHFYADVAYKCRLQKADFYPYYDYFYQQTPREINLNRHQLFFTLGYRF